MDISEEIKQIRQAAVLSQEDFARELDVSFATVNRWERGKTKPTYKTLKALDAFCKERSIRFDAKALLAKEE